RSFWGEQFGHLNAGPLDQALAVLNDGTPEQIQDVIIALGDEAGLRWIRTLSAGESIGGLELDSYIAPFLLVITHQRLLSSLALEKQLYSIYSVLYGIHGRNGHDFFVTVIEKLRNLGLNEKSAALFASISKAFLQTLRSNQEASVSPTFSAAALYDEISAIGGAFRGAANDAIAYHIRVADQTFAKIRQYLHLGGAIPEASAAATRTQNLPGPVPRPLIDLPGELSEKGPRHNNDFHNIELITILPTSDELNSDRPDFLPKRGDSVVHHEQGVKRLLDEQFRLLREDTVGVLRDAVRGVVSSWDTVLGGTAKARASALRRLQTKCVIYPAACLEKFTVDKRDGLVALMSFAQPQQLREKTYAQRKKFCKEDNGHSLQRGNIVALVEGRTHHSVFLLVSDRTIIERRREAEDEEKKDLAVHPARAFIELKLVNPTSTDDQNQLLSVVRCVPGDAILVEFPGLLFASFEPVLKGLQALHRSADVPFVEYIVPRTYESDAEDQLEASGGAMDMPPPLYLSRNPNLVLDLSCITANNFPLTHSVNQPVSIAQLRAHTTLDPGQCQAFIHALSSELALLQGPPGTGKSYIGVQIVKVLLANKRALNLGPVICVCYTNHALDQFLEHLLDSGVTTNMVRMGSRSQSERLQKCTLQSLEKTKTMGEKRLAAICYSKMDGLVDDLKRGVSRAAKTITAVNIGYHLDQTEPQYHRILFPSNGPDEDGFFVASAKSKHSQYKSWSAGRDSHGRPGRVTTNRTLDEIERFLQLSSTGLWDLSLAERKTLINKWEEEIVLSWQNRIRCAVAELTDCQQDLKAQHLESDQRALENVDIIGVTTTGLAANSRLLRSLSTKLLICEEAAEILEAHTITALLPNLEHAVLIGDHLQLRPKISDYKLSLESPRGSVYALDQSLFERLALGSSDSNEKRMQVASLDVQRRMHPRIASLVRETLYPQLRDHSSTGDYPEVGGMRKRLFWLDHSHYEDSAQSEDGPQQTSKTNRWEAEMLIALVRHLKRQGMYPEKEDIAVITPYLGQLRLLKKLLQETFELVLNDRDRDEIALAEENDPKDDEPNEPLVPAFTATTSNLAKGKLSDSVRIATIDNYQGEEAKIILISLHGMFIIGNADTATHIKMWAEVVENLEQDSSIAKALPLCCPRHPDRDMVVVEPEDFARVAPEGGCDAICETCPESKYCQACASESVLSEVVDFIMMETYREIDLNEDPVIWLPCGHAFTLSSMDGSMDIGEVYELDRNGQPVAPKPVPYMQMKVKRCPTCRTAPRRINRYNRAVKTARLDESTKRFMASAAAELGTLQSVITKFEEALDSQDAPFTKDQARLQNRLMRHTKCVADYVRKVSEGEQPYGRVRRLVLDAQRRNTGSTEFDVDSSHIQHGFRFRGSVLLLRMWWAGLAGLTKLRTSARGAENLSDEKKVAWLVSNVRARATACTELEEEAREAGYEKESITAAIYEVQFAALAVQLTGGTSAEDQLARGRERLDECEARISRLRSAQYLMDDVENARRFINAGTFYSLVSSEEKQQVYAAMAREFAGTGHWYLCQEGHPFTVGECGMPMQRARCPECGSAVGGQNHRPDDGVRRATEFEREFANLRVR
ncbi:hypothetical protein HDU87_001723, partial [Geranomyces variabilis]